MVLREAVWDPVGVLLTDTVCDSVIVPLDEAVGERTGVLLAGIG